jgi:hypothetical protein
MTAAFRTERRLVLAAALALGLACDTADDMDDGGQDDAADGSGDDGDDGDDGADDGGTTEGASADGGTMAVSFTVGGTVADSTKLVDPLTGTVYGGIFRTAEVGATGPREGAVQVAFVEATGVDLTTGTATMVMWTSEPLPPDTYTFLGFFDVDGSSTMLEEKDPEEGDPVTLPTANKVTVEDGAAAQLEVRFDLVL